MGRKFGFSHPLDYDASDYFNRIAAAGGTISAAHKAAVNAFVVGAKRDGFWSAIVDCCPFAGNQLAAALVKLKHAGGQPASCSHNGVDYSVTAGVGGDGASTSVDTGVAFGTITAAGASAHMAAYCAGALGSRYMGAGENVDSHSYMPYNFGANFCWGNGTDVDESSDGGMRIATRGASGNAKLYRAFDGDAFVTVIADNAVDGSSPSAHTVTVCAALNDPFGGSWSSTQVGFYSMGTALTSTQALNLFVRTHALMTAFGRQFPPTVAPGVPNSVTATDDGEGGPARVSWTAGEGVIDSYNIYRSDDGGSFELIDNSPQHSDYVDNSTVNDGTTYSYKVSASNNFAGEGPQSAATAPITIA